VIGGVPSLQKAGLDPVGEIVWLAPAEPDPVHSHKQGEYEMGDRKKSTFQRLANGLLNRKQRRELERKLSAEDPGLEIVNRNVAGIDVGNESHFVAVPPGRDAQPVQEFGSWMADLERMAEWLKACRIEKVVMQSTGVYWIALFDVLEARGFKICLANARHTKNLPGRKSDVQESQWLLKLHTYGLLRDSFRPPDEIRALRSLWRLRDRHVKEAARAVQHMQKSMITMNVQLSNAISDISGVTGPAIIRAILAGERDSGKLAKLRDWRVKATEEEVARSLEGNWREDMLFELKQAVEAYDFYQKQIAACDQRLQELMAGLPTREVETAAPAIEAAKPVRKKRAHGKQKNAPRFDLHAELERVCGVDLTGIDGIDVMTAQTIVAELGTDFTRWKDEAHFASWLGLSPSRDVSGGKIVRQGTLKKVKNRVATALRTAANTLLHSDSYLGARFRSLQTRRGAPKAIKAMARYLACLIYRMFIRGQAWVDRGAREFENRRAQHELSALQRKAAAQGFKLVSINALT
jgi:transposase